MDKIAVDSFVSIFSEIIERTSLCLDDLMLNTKGTYANSEVAGNFLVGPLARRHGINPTAEHSR
jgi:hypothetical protein